jgi:ribosomal subunit interface protein
MQKPLCLTFRHLDRSAALEERVRELTDRLERFHRSIISCGVTIEAPPAHRHKGGPFAVKVELTIPGSVINVNSAHAVQPQHADVYVALRDAFDSVKRQLQDDERRQRIPIPRSLLGSRSD